MLRPGATGKDLVELLDGRAERTLTLHWRAGRVRAPRWAIRMLVDKIERESLARLERAKELDKEKERLGLSAGALNLRKYHANRNR